MTRTVLSLGNFFSVAQLFLIVYILGPYLSQTVPAEETGLVLASGAVLALIAFPLVPDLIARFNARRLLIALAALEALVLLWLASAPSSIAALILVAVACALPSLISYQLDLLLEATMDQEAATGRVRTVFLTYGNIAVILGTLAAGAILSRDGSYAMVFFASAVALVPLIFLFIARRLPHGAPPEKVNMQATVERAIHNRDLRAVSLSFLVLQSFYQLTRLYLPLYFHEVLGMPWSELGWVLAVSLVPFVLVEYPAGLAVDKYLNDKEFLFVGFVGTGFAYALVSFIGASTPLAFILAVLLVMNVCAAMTEAATESHFFRRVSERDASTIGAFRMVRPLSALVAPLVGSLLLALFGYSALFVLSGTLIIGLGSYAAFSMRGGAPAA